ncbi:MAG TPA: PqqD family peptide modification chaperone [Kofleriaceae bacterium]|nr:PqqD family peptide modification chaperone [Kofleriaceae bacterium]
MKLCLLIKYPPIQGGVSAQGFWVARALAQRGHELHVVTHANEVEPAYRLMLDDEDRAMLESRFERGSVQLHWTEPMSRKLAYIPQANPFVSKLAGRATDVIERFGCELIFSYYFEPYGVAGALAKSWTHVPQVIRHAGSDLGRLMLNPDLAPTYSRILRGADGILSGNRHPFAGLGVPADRVHGVAPYFLPTEFFRPDAPPLDMTATLAMLSRMSPDVVSPGPFDAGVPTIGIYGKVGEQKGSFDLVKALAIVKQRGADFNFVALTQGTQSQAFRQAVSAAGLDDRTYILPFIAHWKVARFIRACTAVCFLERDFTISFHTPSVPKEVLACETCLVLSGEILDKQAYKSQLVDGENFVSIPDPRDIAQLAAALERVVRDPEAAREIGRRGGQVTFRKATSDELGAAYEQVFDAVLARHRGGRDDLPALPDVAARTADLRAVLPQLSAAMDDAELARLAEIHAEQPVPPAGANADAEAFIARIERVGGVVDRDVLAFSRHLLWMGRPAPGENVARPFGERLDELPERGGRAELPSLAPLRSLFARVVTFERLSESLIMRKQPGPPSRCTVLFNKQANFLGHYFVINEWSARLLELCDGRRTVAELVQHYAAEDKQHRGPEAIRELVVNALQSFYRHRVVIFIDPVRARTE